MSYNEGDIKKAVEAARLLARSTPRSLDYEPDDFYRATLEFAVRNRPFQNPIPPLMRVTRVTK